MSVSQRFKANMPGLMSSSLGTDLSRPRLCSNTLIETKVREDMSTAATKGTHSKISAIHSCQAEDQATSKNLLTERKCELS